MHGSAANDERVRRVGDSDGDSGFPAMSRAETKLDGLGLRTVDRDEREERPTVSSPCLPAKYPAETARALLTGSQGGTRHVCPVCLLGKRGRQVIEHG